MKLLLCLAIAVAVHATDHGIRTAKLPKITHGHHVEHHRKVITSPAPKHLPNAMNRTMELHFSTSKHTFALNLHLFEGLYSPNAVVKSGDANGNIVNLQPRFRSYHGQAAVAHWDGSDREFGRCSVTFYNDNRYHALIVTSKDVYTVDMNDDRLGYPLHGKDSGLGMHVVPDSARKSDQSYLDFVLEMADKLTNGGFTRQRPKPEATNEPSPSDTYFNDFWVPSSSAEARSSFGMRSDMPGSKGRGSARKLQQLVTFDQCYPNQYQNVLSLKMGIVTDSSFDTRIRQLSSIQTDADVQTWLEAVISDSTQIIYMPQLNVYLEMNTLMMGAATANMRFQLPCSNSASERLSALREWRRDYYQVNTDTVGLWHLFTNCHPPAGTVGIAYVGVICSRSNGYGTGLTNYLGGGTWTTFAHEVGHNFAASHSFENGQGDTGGIMDYGPGYFPLQPASARVYQFNPLRKAQICAEITASLRISNCWSPFPPPNGVYQWEATGIWDTSLCSTACDNSGRFQTMAYTCYDLAGGTKTKVNSAYCETLSHLVPHTQPCAPCTPTVTCGNNIIEMGEVCDDSTNCCQNCQSILPTAGCLVKSAYTNAAFSDSLGRVFVVQGAYYSRYTSFSSYPTPDEGYPKPANASAVFQAQQMVGSPITAAAAKSDGEVYVFFGMRYVIKDVAGATITRPGQTGNASIDFALPSNFIACGKIDSATAIDNAFFLFFCDWNYVLVPFTRTANDVHPLLTEPIVSLGITSLDLPVSAVFLDKDGTFYYFQGDKYTAIRARQVLAGFPKGAASVFTNSKAFQNLQLPQQMCTDPNCASCPTSPSACAACDQLFTLHGSQCYDSIVMAWVTFDKGSSQDQVFLKNDPLGQYSNLGNAQQNLYFQPGVRNESFVFQSQLSIPLAPLALDANPVKAFEISMWFKPAGVHNGTWFEMDNQVRVEFRQKTNISFALTLYVNEQPFDCFVDAPITVGQWNKVEVRLENGVFWTGANGIFHRRATINYGGANTFVRLPLNSWTIGSVSRPSIAGQMDDFVFRRLDTPANPSTVGGSAAAAAPEPLAQEAVIGIVVAAVVVVMICCCAAMWKFYCVPKHGGCPSCEAPSCDCCGDRSDNRTSLAANYKQEPNYIVTAKSGGVTRSSEGQPPQPPQPPTAGAPPPVPGSGPNPFSSARAPPSRGPGYGGSSAPPRPPGRPNPPTVPSYVR